MWRPFAGSFVNHSLDSFIVNHEKLKINSISSSRKEADSSPLSLTQADLEKRLDMFKSLQQKVANQREQIKIKDLVFERKLEKKLRYKKKGKIVADKTTRISKRKTLSTEGDEVLKKGELKNDSKIGLPLIKRKTSQ